MTQVTKPSVTIVTITFNLIRSDREKTFRQCLESVHNQTYENIEHIVVDGASKDGTVDLIKEYADKGWIKYVSEPDTGIYDAMNKGIKLANGKYISFLNSDDYYHGVTGIESSVKKLLESNADFSFAPVVIMNENGTINISHPHSSPKISNVFFEMPFCHQSMLTKKSVFLQENMFDLNYKSSGDYDFLVRICLKKYKCIMVDDTFVTYRLGGLSDANRKQSVDESARSYRENYKTLAAVSQDECEKICSDGVCAIPLKLAKEFSKYEHYFNYDEYLENTSLIAITQRNIKLFYNLLVAKLSFIVFSPRKFMYKYLNMVIKGRTRQILRRVFHINKRGNNR